MQPNIVSRPSREAWLIPPALFLSVSASSSSVLPSRSGLTAATERRQTDHRAGVRHLRLHGRARYPADAPGAARAGDRFLNKLPSRYKVAVVTFANKVHLTVAPTFDRARP